MLHLFTAKKKHSYKHIKTELELIQQSLFSSDGPKSFSSDAVGGLGNLKHDTASRWLLSHQAAAVKCRVPLRENNGSQGFLHP